MSAVLFNAVEITQMAIEARDNSCACTTNLHYTCPACKMYGELIQHVVEAGNDKSKGPRNG